MLNGSDLDVHTGHTEAMFYSRRPSTNPKMLKINDTDMTYKWTMLNGSDLDVHTGHVEV